MSERDRIEPSDAAIGMLASWANCDDLSAKNLLHSIYAIDLAQMQKSYDKLAARANQLEYLVGSIADLLRRDMTNE